LITVGSHAFTEQHARSTLRHGSALVGLLTEGLPEERLADVRPMIDQTLDLVQRVADDEDTPLDDRLSGFWSAWREAASALRSSGVLGPPAEGIVAHLATSDGGVPKASAETIDVGWGGVVGDRQADRRDHGRPWQALCLWSTEVIDAFNAGGDRLAPGAAGENVTVTGLPWERVRPGSVLRVGSVTCEVWAYAVPCAKNAQWFADGDFNRMHHRNGPVSRIYAAVTEPGTITLGDRAVLLPPD